MYRAPPSPRNHSLQAASWCSEEGGETSQRRLVRLPATTHFLREPRRSARSTSTRTRVPRGGRLRVRSSTSPPRREQLPHPHSDSMQVDPRFPEAVTSCTLLEIPVPFRCRQLQTSVLRAPLLHNTTANWRPISPAPRHRLGGRRKLDKSRPSRHNLVPVRTS